MQLTVSDVILRIRETKGQITSGQGQVTTMCIQKQIVVEVTASGKVIHGNGKGICTILTCSGERFEMISWLVKKNRNCTRVHSITSLKTMFVVSQSRFRGLMRHFMECTEHAHERVTYNCPCVKAGFRRLIPTVSKLCP